MKRRTGKTAFAAAAISLLAAVFGVAGAAGLTLEEALSRMEASNDTLAAARQDKAASEHERQAASGLYLPQVDMAGQWTRIDEPIAIGLDVPPVTGPPITLPGISASRTVQDDTFVKAHITASLPLYAGGQIRAANQAAASRVAEADARLRQTGSSLKREMVTRYYGLRFAKKVVDVRRAYLEGMEKHLAEARKLEASGMISRSERLHAEVARAEAERELKRAVRDQAIADTALVNLLGLGDGGTDPVSPLFLTRQIEPLEHFTSAALRLSPMLKRIDEKGVQADAGVKAEKGAMRPKVYLFANHELVKEDLTILEPTWAVGVGVEMSLFKGFSSVNHLRAAQSRKAEVGHLAAQARKDIITLTEKLYHEVVAQIEQYEALQASQVLAEEAVRVQVRAFEEGFGTSLDVVDARLTLSGVQIRQLKAVYDYCVALVSLLETAGLAGDFHTYRNEKEQEVNF